MVMHSDSKKKKIVDVAGRCNMAPVQVSPRPVKFGSHALIPTVYLGMPLLGGAAWHPSGAQIHPGSTYEAESPPETTAE